jgi:hypothetical protein
MHIVVHCLSELILKIRAIAKFKSFVKIPIIKIIVVDVSVMFHCTKLYLFKCNGS